MIDIMVFTSTIRKETVGDKTYRIAEVTYSNCGNKVATEFVIDYKVQVKSNIFGIIPNWVTIKDYYVNETMSKEDIEFELNEANECLNHIINPYELH